MYCVSLKVPGLVVMVYPCGHDEAPHVMTLMSLSNYLEKDRQERRKGTHNIPINEEEANNPSIYTPVSNPMSKMIACTLCRSQAEYKVSLCIIHCVMIKVVDECSVFTNVVFVCRNAASIL